MNTFDPDPKEIDAFALWLELTKEAVAVYMPNLGGLPDARAHRVAQVAEALQMFAIVAARGTRG